MKKDHTYPAVTPTRRHLAASMQVVARCLGLPRVSVAATRYMVMEAARQQEEGTPRPEVAQLRADLERETGCPIADLADDARGWSVSPPPA